MNAASTATTEPTGIEPCPYCDGTSGVQQITGTPPKVQGWSCAVCGTDWWITVVNPRPQRSLERLTETVKLQVAQLALRELIALTDEASTLSDDQLRARLVDLARAARSGCRRDC